MSIELLQKIDSMILHYIMIGMSAYVLLPILRSTISSLLQYLVISLMMTLFKGRVEIKTKDGE